MKLYTWAQAPNPRRVAIFAAEKHIEIPTEDVGDGAMLKAEYLRKSTLRRVPMLELDDGTCIGQAMAICRYLEALHPEPALLGRTPKEAAVIEMWERYCEYDGIFAVADVFRNKVRAFEGRSLSGYRAVIPQVPALIERGQVRVREFFETLDEQLAHRAYVASAQFSMADITALCATDFARLSRLEIPASCAHVLRWHAEVSARPSVANTK